MTVGASSASSDARISPITSGWFAVVLELGLPAGGADEVAHPLAGAHDVAGVRGIGADARDAEELGELLHPVCRRLRHRRRSLGA